MNAETPSGTADIASQAARERLLTIAPWLHHPQSIRAVFFDVGFTLLRPHPTLIEVVQRVAASQGVSISLDDLRARYPAANANIIGSHHITGATWADNATINATWGDYFTALLAPSIPDPAQLATCVATTLEEMDRHVAWQPYEDVIPTLARLKERYIMGVISDWGISLGSIMRGHDLHHYFAFQIVSATSRRAKPDPALFAEALRRGDTLGDYTLYVGDTYVQDILGARSVGIHPILLDRRGRLDPTLVDCPVIHDLHALLTLLEIA